MDKHRKQPESTIEPPGSQQKRGIFYWYALILSRWYVIFVLIGVPLLFLGLGVTAVVLHFPNFEDPTKGFEATGTPIHSRLLALYNLRRRYDILSELPRIYRKSNGDMTSDGTTVPETFQRRRRQTNDSSSMTTNVPLQQPLSVSLTLCEVDNFAKMMFGTSKDGGDLFTTSAIKSMCLAEEQLIRSHSEFHQSCQQYWFSECPVSWSLGNYVAILNNKQSCDDIDDNDVVNTRALLTRCAPYYFKWLNSSSNPSASCGFEQAPLECSQFNAAHTILHFLVTTDFSSRISHDPNVELKYVTHIIPTDMNYEHELLSVYLDSFHQKSYKYNEVTLKSLDFGIKFNLFEIFFISDLLYVGIGLLFVILVLWVYTQSIIITLAACLNCILSFLMAYFFYFIIFRRTFFPFVNIVSAVLIIGIGVDDTFVYCDIWHKSLSDFKKAPLHVKVQNTLHHATATMLVTSLTTAGSLYASIISNITAVKCFALFSGTAILMNFLLTLTLLPATIIIQHRLVNWYNKGNRGRHETGCSKFCGFLGKIRTVCVKPIRHFFHRILPIVIIKLRFIWLIVFGALGIGGALVVFKYPGLQLPSTSEFQILRDDNLIELWGSTYRDLFGFSGDDKDHMEGSIVFGTLPVDVGDTWDPDDRGELILDDSFAFYTPEHQLWMIQFCDDLKDQDFYQSIKIRSFMESLQEFMSRPCLDPLLGDLSPCCSIQSFPYTQDVFETCIRKCAAFGPCFFSVRFNIETDKLAAILIVYESSTPNTFDYNIMQNYWKDTNSWMERHIEDAPESLKNGWIISRGSKEDQQLGFYDLQNSLARGAPLSLAIAIAVVFVILLVTIGNVILALYAILTVASAVFVTVACLVLLGWELNIFESVIMTLAVGLCVDFTIHYGVAYKLARVDKLSRYLRTDYSIYTMTGAITVAALSTFLAGVFMLAANINAYLQLGLFLTLVMSISWTYSTFFFQSLCRVLGIQGRFGDVCGCCKSSRNDTDGIGQNNDSAHARGRQNEAFTNNDEHIQLS